MIGSIALGLGVGLAVAALNDYLMMSYLKKARRTGRLAPGLQGPLIGRSLVRLFTSAAAIVALSRNLLAMWVAFAVIVGASFLLALFRRS